VAGVIGWWRRTGRAKDNQRKVFTEILRKLGENLDKHIVENPDFAARIPNGSYIVIQISVPPNTDPNILRAVELFNRWVRKLAEQQRESGQPVVVATCVLPPIPVQASHDLTPTFVEQAPVEYVLQPA